MVSSNHWLVDCIHSKLNSKHFLFHSFILFLLSSHRSLATRSPSLLVKDFDPTFMYIHTCFLHTQNFIPGMERPIISPKKSCKEAFWWKLSSPSLQKNSYWIRICFYSEQHYQIDHIHIEMELRQKQQKAHYSHHTTFCF